MASYGKPPEFEENVEDWDQYIERMENYFVANGIRQEEKKRSLLLAVISPANYRLLRSLVSPQKPSDKLYDEVVAVMKAHHCPKPSVIVQRFRFHNRFRQPGESVSTYISELRALSEHCGFGLCLDDMLRDRLVCGVKDDAIQRKLLAETDLTLQKASAIAISMETASKDAQILISFGGATVPEKEPESSPRAETIHRVQDKPARKFVGCSCCGKRHPSSICRFKNATCYACGKVGHIKSVCRSRRLETTTKSNQQVNCMQPEEDSTTNTVSEDYEEYTMFNLEKEKKVQPLRASVLIDGKPLSVTIVSGSPC